MDSYIKDVLNKNPQASWINRAIFEDLKTLDNKTVFSGTVEMDGKHYVFPRVRKSPFSGKLEEYDDETAIQYGVKNKDLIGFDTAEEAEELSKYFSKFQETKNITEQDRFNNLFGKQY